MKNFLVKFAAFLLFLNSVAAIFGGGNLMNYPDGSSLSLSIAWLKHSPFHNYLIPGAILFLANGLQGIIILALILTDYKKYPALIMAQGIILCAWLITEVAMIRTILNVHIFTFAVGVLLIACGWKLTKINSSDSKENKDIASLA